MAETQKKLSLILGAKDRLSSVISGIDKKSDRLWSRMSKGAKRASDAFSKVGKGSMIAGTAIFGGITAGIGLVQKLSTSVAQTGDRIDKMSQKVGMSSQAFQEWEYVMSQNGGNIDSLVMGNKTLTTQVAAVNKGNKDATKLFRSLGVSIKGSNGQLKSQETIFKETVKAIQNIKNPTQKAIAANKLFGRSAAELKPLFNQSADSVDKLVAKAHDLGMIRTDAEVKACVKLTDTTDTLKRAMGGLGMTIGMQLVPYAQKFEDTLIRNIPRIKKEVLPVVSQGIKTIATFSKEHGKAVLALGSSLVVFGAVSSAIGKTISVVTGFIDTYRNLAKFMRTYRFATEIKAILNVGKAFQAVGTAVAGLGLGPVLAIAAGLVGAAILIVKYWHPIVALFKGFGDGLKQSLAPVIQSLSPVFQKLGAVLAPVGNWFRSLFTPINTTGKASYNLGVQIGRLVGGFTKFVVKAALWVTGITPMYKMLQNIGKAAKWAGDKVSGVHFGKGNDKVSGKGAKVDGSHANGLANVPFNGYIAELHKGERVLTANENRNLVRSGTPSGGSINVTFAPVIHADANTDTKTIENIVREQCSRFIAQIQSAQNRRMAGAYAV